MEEKFKYRSKRFKTVLIVYILLCIFVLPALTVLSCALLYAYIINSVIVAFTVAMVPFFVGAFVVFYWFDNVPSKFIADKNFVEFKLLFKKINIRYSSIKSIKVTHEYAKPQIRGDVGGYKEIIKFVCREGEYQFENIMDIDFEQTAAEPENLSEQFECGKFMRLKNYISRQTGVTY